MNKFVLVPYVFDCTDKSQSSPMRQELELEILGVFSGYFVSHEFDLEFDYLHGCSMLEVVLIVKKSTEKIKNWPTSRTDNQQHDSRKDTGYEFRSVSRHYDGFRRAGKISELPV